jgi:ABC-type branched-subunit amino acid transport system substrate-binding protein
MNRRSFLVAAALSALFAAGCGSSSSSSAGGSSSSSASTSAAAGGSGGKCAASIGIEAPLTGQVAMLGQEQLHFAQLATSMDNQANGPVCRSSPDRQPPPR